MKYQIIAVLALLVFWPLSVYASDDERAIARLIVESYVEGVYINRDEQVVLRGFHPDFVLHVNRGARIATESLTQWLQRLNLDGIKSSQTVDHEIVSIDVTGDSAVAKLLIFLDSRLVYTDYFGFYKSDGDWLFVNKIFSDHE